MDIFEVLTAISKRKKRYMNSGIKGREALLRAELDISNELHISLADIERLVGQSPEVSEGRQRRLFT